MNSFSSHDIVPLILLFLVGFAAGLLIVLYSLKRYESAVALILLSPWVHWLFNPGHEGDMESAPTLGTYIRISMVVLAGTIGIFQLMRHNQQKHNGHNKGLPYLLLLGGFVFYALFSTLYSIDKKYTVIRSAEFVFFFFFLCGFYCWLNDRMRLDKVLNIYCMIMICGIVINITAFALFPGRVRSSIMPDRFQGLLEHPNSLGAFCMLSYPILMWQYSRFNDIIGKLLLAFLFCIIFLMHILSGSRSSLITAVIGFFLWPIMSGKAELNNAAKILVLVLIVIFGVIFLLHLKPAGFKRSTSDITNLTGRTEFWQGCIRLIKEKPITGYGYGVAGKIWSDQRFQKKGQFLWSGSARASLHNGYLSITVGLGLPGLLIWLSLVLIPLQQVVRLCPSNYKALILIMLVQGIVLNFFETSIVSGSQILTSLVFWLFLIMAQRLPVPATAVETNSLTAVSFIPVSGRIHAV